MIKSPVIELSDNSKKVRCNICEPLHAGHDRTWIKKDSLTYHLKSDLHAHSVRAQEVRESNQIAREQSMREESAMEESMDFVMLSSTINAAVMVTTHVPRTSLEEKEMWDNHEFSNETFDAGIDHTAAAVKERRRLEQEATDFDLWHGADFLPEEDPNDGELLLDELEQDNILTELLRNAHTYISFNCVYRFQCVSCFWIDLDVPADVADLLEKEAGSQPKIPDAWSPYESKMVS